MQNSCSCPQKILVQWAYLLVAPCAAALPSLRRTTGQHYTASQSALNRTSRHWIWLNIWLYYWLGYFHDCKWGRVISSSATMTEIEIRDRKNRGQVWFIINNTNDSPKILKITQIYWYQIKMKYKCLALFFGFSSSNVNQLYWLLFYDYFTLLPLFGHIFWLINRLNCQYACMCCKYQLCFAGHETDFTDQEEEGQPPRQGNVGMAVLLWSR